MELQGQMSQAGWRNSSQTFWSAACPPIMPHLLAIDLVVLRGSDLPLAIALQPGIGPDLALFRVGMRFVFADGVLAAVNDGNVFARRRREEVHLRIVEFAAVRRVWSLFIA